MDAYDTHGTSIINRDVPKSIFLPDIGYMGRFFYRSAAGYRIFNNLEEQHKLRYMAVGENAQPIQMNEKE